jgi:ribose 5-phosphate isomerase A
MHAGLQQTNWIPRQFQDAAKNLAKEAVERFVRPNRVLGLGSGPMAAAIVREMGNFDRKETLECIPTSFQIKLEARCSGLKLVDEDKLPEIDVVFDGADEVDANFNMIKGGGGALLREKIVHSAAKRIVIAAESSKFVTTFSWPVPIEITPFAVHSISKRLEDIGSKPVMRMLKEDYPYVTENGNFILDTFFHFPLDIRGQEIKLKNIPGIVEVGLFTKLANVYYKANEDGAFETIENP